MARLRLAGFILVCVLITATGASAGMPERTVLDNGLVMILAPIPGSGQVAVESFYRTGFIDEPEGMPQLSHLVEHLVCQSATKSFKAGESYELLNKGRMTNAETMPCFTHFDYQVSSADLELALRVEGERLSSLSITQDVISRELPKCYDEAAQVERNPQLGMYKFAFAAFGQAWRYKATSATVKSGLEKVPAAKIQEYHRSRYQPSGAVLTLVGDFDRARALGMAKKHLGGIPSQKVDPPKPIEWAKLPSRTEVRWDSGLRALCIAFRPTADVTDRYLLHTWGGLLSPTLMSDEKIAKIADFVTCSDPVWTLNSMPFFIYAVPKPAVSIDDLRKALESRLLEMLSQPQTKDDLAQVIAIARQIGKVPVPAREVIADAAKQIYPLMDAKQGEAMVMGQVALEFGFEELIARGDPNYLSIPSGTTPDAVLARLREMLDPSREFITVLTPMQVSKP